MRAWMRGAFTIGVLSNILTTLPKWLLLISACSLVLSLTGCGSQIGILNPKGIIAYHERKLFFDTLALMLIVVLPVIVMSIVFVYHYQVSHHIRDYKPNWGHNYFLETLWWGIPCVIIVILAILTWKKTHELDPYKPINGASNASPLLIQVIALPWKWLFIYPQQQIATINYLEIPIDQQVEYWITADNVPMSSFFIPQLGSQIYAMAGMRTRLHLLANEPGMYDGLNTQYNGDGFSDMHFPVHAVTPQEMQQWLNQVKQSPDHLSAQVYDQLLNPTIKDKPRFFNGIPADLFNHVVNAYANTFGPVHPRSGHIKFQG